MAITIKLTFPAGRTTQRPGVGTSTRVSPSGRHHLGGCSALVAVWRRTCPGIPEKRVKHLLAALAHPPSFRLPPHRVAHTRHYMPWEKKGPADRTLVFDTFVSVRRDAALFLGWPDAELSADQLSMLETILGNLTSLGRTESWVRAELTSDQPLWNCQRVPESDSNPTPVFCPDSSTAFADEYYPVLDAKKLLQGKVKPRGVPIRLSALAPLPRYGNRTRKKMANDSGGKMGELYPAGRTGHRSSEAKSQATHEIHGGATLA